MPAVCSYWCLVGNGWECGNGMIIRNYYGSFPHSLLSTSKFCLPMKFDVHVNLTYVPWRWLVGRRPSFRTHRTWPIIYLSASHMAKKASKRGPSWPYDGIYQPRWPPWDGESGSIATTTGDISTARALTNSEIWQLRWEMASINHLPSTSCYEDIFATLLADGCFQTKDYPARKGEHVDLEETGRQRGWFEYLNYNS